MASKEVSVPDIGDFQDVEIVEVHVKAGDVVAAEDALITLETDKAAMEVPAPEAGRVVEMRVSEGDRVSEGSVILTLDADGSGAAADEAPAASPPEAPAAPATAEPPKPAAPPPEKAAPAASGAVSAAGRLRALPPVDEAGFAVAHAGPSVRRLARELGVNLGQVTGSGPKGRITHEDVKEWVKATLSAGPVTAAAALPAVPEVDHAKFGEVDVQPLSRIQKISGPRLHASWVNVPHVTHNDEADITELEALRKQLKPGIAVAEAGTRLTMMTFLVMACVRALKEFPGFNASLDGSGDNLVYKKYYNIGFAADTPNGLVVPVIKGADEKSIVRIAKDLGDLSRKAREGKLPATDMQGGTFTISSLGGIGGTAFTPIINAPEVAILGVSRAKMQPVYRDGEFVPRLILPLSLSYDHRVIDGAAAARFTAQLAAILQDANSFKPEGVS